MLVASLNLVSECMIRNKRERDVMEEETQLTTPAREEIRKLMEKRIIPFCCLESKLVHLKCYFHSFQKDIKGEFSLQVVGSFRKVEKLSILFVKFYLHKMCRNIKNFC